MQRTTFVSATAFLLPLTSIGQSTSPKRGLCHVPSEDHPNDDLKWLSGPSNPTWYYNYQATPSSAYADSNMQFVPMLWGASASDTGTPFYDSVKRQIEDGANISYVLGFNEPDAAHAVGGSNLEVTLAAERWKAEIEPLKELGVNIGAPGVTGAESGWTWLKNWFEACEGGCNPDFIPVHWYGNFDGMMSHLGRVTSKWPNLTVWVTEYGYPGQDLDTTQEFYNMSVRGFDDWPNITHYSYFGAFRSDVSNVGHNAAMLTESGELTDIGSWYMGGAVTNNIPQASSSILSLSVFESKWHCLAVLLHIWVFLS